MCPLKLGKYPWVCHLPIGPSGYSETPMKITVPSVFNSREDRSSKVLGYLVINNRKEIYKKAL